MRATRRSADAFLTYSAYSADSLNATRSLSSSRDVVCVGRLNAERRNYTVSHSAALLPSHPA